MLKDLFLTPGRILSKFFIREKRKAYRSARSRPAESLGTVLLSLVCWLALAGCVLYSIDKAGFLKQALDVGVEVATGDETNEDPQPTQDEPQDSEIKGSLEQEPVAPPPATPPTTATGNPAAQAESPGEMWLVILHSIPKSGREEAERRQAQYRGKGLEVEILDTDAFPLLQGSKGESWWIIALGPFDSKAEALSASNKARSFNNGLMVRRGL